MKSARCQSDDDISRPNRFPVQHSRFFDHSNDRAADVILARLIEPGHLRSLTTDERATVFGASFGEAFNDVGEDTRLQFPSAQVIEKEQRLCPQNSNVVDTVIYQVLADRVVTIEGESDFELGANAINTGDEDGLLVFLNCKREEAAEAANFAENLGTMCCR